MILFFFSVSRYSANLTVPLFSVIGYTVPVKGMHIYLLYEVKGTNSNCTK